MRKIELLDEYVVCLDYESTEAVVGHIHHVLRNDAGGQQQTPVGLFAAHIDPGDDMRSRHWAIEVFLRSDVRYDPRTHETTVVSNPKRQAGSNLAMLRRLEQIRDGGLPLYHAELPEELGRLLIRDTACDEPAVVRIHHSTNESFVEFGEIWEPL